MFPRATVLIVGVVVQKHYLPECCDPYGDESVECVAEGNRLNQICGLLITICFMCNVQWCIEQPGSSLFLSYSAVESDLARAKSVSAVAAFESVWARVAESHTFSLVHSAA